MSVSINLDLAGAEEFLQALNRFDTAMQNRVQEQLLEWAESVKADAERLVPVRTGYLQSTIFAKSQGWQIEVGAEATYAAAVEFGTRYARAKPYLTPAVEAYLPSLERVLLEALDLAKGEAQL
jgi:HK97 gp10 family phage protein